MGGMHIICIDGPTHYLTLNRLSKLIPHKVSKSSTDLCHNSIFHCLQYPVSAIRVN